MRSDAPDGEKEFETVSQTRKHQITWPIGNHILPSFRGKATSILTIRCHILNRMAELGRPVSYAVVP